MEAKNHEVRQLLFERFMNSLFFKLKIDHHLEIHKLDKEKEEAVKEINKEKKEALDRKNKEKEEVFKRKNKEIEEVLERKNKETKELLERKNKEIKEALERKYKEKEELKDKLNQITFEKELQTIELLRAQNRLNLRGAVEYCRFVLRSRNKELKFNGHWDDLLKLILSNNTEFMDYLKSSCAKLLLKETDVSKCLFGLYHELSNKSHRGVKDQIAIFEADWTTNERAALMILFEYCNILYTLYKDGVPLKEKPL